jgi:hypothetical protein
MSRALVQEKMLVCVGKQFASLIPLAIAGNGFNKRDNIPARDASNGTIAPQRYHFAADCALEFGAGLEIADVTPNKSFRYRHEAVGLPRRFFGALGRLLSSWIDAPAHIDNHGPGVFTRGCERVGQGMACREGKTVQAMPSMRRTGWPCPLTRRMTLKEAAPLSVTRMQRPGTAVSQTTVLLPDGAGLRPRSVGFSWLPQKSIHGCHKNQNVLGNTMGQRSRAVNGCFAQLADITLVWLFHFVKQAIIWLQCYPPLTGI